MYPRLVKDKLAEALADTRVVLVAGPRQAGKSTLVREIGGTSRPYLTLDDPTTLDAARSDPSGFVRGLDHATIDEVQRAPDLFLALKDSVDRDPRPGRFLLTGSANLLSLPATADSLAGRMEVVRLLPLSQAEIRLGHAPQFLERAFRNQNPVATDDLIGPDLVGAVLAGGYPEAVARKTWSRRQDWARQYLDALIQRDVRYISGITRRDQMPRLLRALADHSAQLTNFNGIGAQLGMNDMTTRSYTSVFEHLYLVRTLPAWHSNAMKRLIKSPKLHFLDTGLLAAVRGLTPKTIARDRQPFGAILESFVVSEVLKLADGSDQRLTFSHYRDKDGAEVDLVIENDAGDIVGIEVKASATVRSTDFTGLKRLAAAAGDRFVQGLVLHDHDRAVPFGERLWAAPISTLWA